ELPFLPRITDFGLAKATESALAQTASSAMMGTPLYMAPEQAKSEFEKINPATDVYAIGALLYELLTGTPPFQGSMTEVLDRVRHEEPKSPRGVDASIPLDLETICIKCLSKVQADRYQNAGDLLDDLRAFREGRPIRGRRVSGLKRLSYWLQRPSIRKRVGVMGFLTLTSLAIVLIAQQYWRVPVSSPNAMDGGNVQSAQNLQIADKLRKAHGLLLVGKLQEAIQLIEPLSDSPSPAIQSYPWRFLRARLARQSHHYLGLPGKLLCATMSPDSQWIVAGDRLGNICIWRFGTQQPFKTLNYSDKEVCAIAFSPDGKMLATAGQDSLVHLWSCENWEENHVFKEPGGTNTAVAWSPDSKQLISGNRGKRISIWNVEDGSRATRLNSVGDVVRNVAWSPDGKFVAANVADKVKIWSTDQWQLVSERGFRDSDGDPESLYALTFTQDSATLMCGGNSKSIHMLDMRQPDRELRPIDTRDLYTVSESPDGEVIVAGLYAGGSVLWSSSTFAEIVTLEESFSIVRAAMISNDNKFLLSAHDDDSKVTVWNLASILGYETVSSGIGLLAQRYADDRTVSLRTSESDTFVYDWKTCEQIQLSGKSQAATFSHDAKLLARSTIGGIEVLDLTTRDVVCRFESPSYVPNELAFSGDKQHLIAHSTKGDWTLYDLRAASITALGLTDNNDYPIYAFSSDDRQVVVLRHPRENMRVERFELRSTADGAVIQEFFGRTVDSLAFDRAGSQLFLAQHSGIAIHDLKTNLTDNSRFRPRQKIERIAISPDNLAIAAWVKNEGVFLWDVATGEELFCVLSTTEVIDQLEWSGESVLQCRASRGDSQRLLRFKLDTSP
ncbi:MAG: protein kinase, partial [Pirellulales bacterium]